ncbi:MAG: dienelactone hydrolase family protein [Dehalococcoidia bacterium]
MEDFRTALPSPGTWQRQGPAPSEQSFLFHGFTSLLWFAELTGQPAAPWPATVPVQVHYSERDPYREEEWIKKFERSVKEGGASYTFYEYPGEGHLFADEGLSAEYDPESAELMWSRVVSFLDSL